MTEVLSQGEIDELLTAISTGGYEDDGTQDPYEREANGPRKRIKIYDFKRPDVFSKEQVRTLANIHDYAARKLIKVFSDIVPGKEVQVYVASVDQLTLEEYLRSVPNPTILYTVDILPLKNIIVELEPKLLLALEGKSWYGDGPEGMTGLEKWAQNLVDAHLGDPDKILRALQGICENLASAWTNVGKVKLKNRSRFDEFEGELESNPQFITSVPPNETCALITFEIKIGEEECTFCVGYPSQSIPKEFMKALKPNWMKVNVLSSPPEIKRSTMPANTLPHLSNLEILKDIPVTIEVRLGATRQALGDALQIGEGTILALDKLAGDAVDVLVNNKLFAHGEVVVIDEHFGVRVTETLGPIISETPATKVDED